MHHNGSTWKGGGNVLDLHLPGGEDLSSLDGGAWQLECMMRFLPLGIDLQDRPCTVVGGGAVGTRKVENLLRVGARVTVVAPVVTEGLLGLIEAGLVHWIQDGYRPEHLEGAALVVMAADDAGVNEAGTRRAVELGALACNASAAGQTPVIFGALLETDGATVATFTDGRDPTRARQTRDRIAAALGCAAPAASPADDSVLILVAHGSRNPEWNAALEELVAGVAARVGGRVRLAHSQFASPSLEEAVDRAAGDGARHLAVLPLFMTTLGQVDRLISPVVARLQQRHPDVQVELLPPVGQHQAFQELLVDLVQEHTA
jgi:siroheme synthase-like protein